MDKRRKIKCLIIIGIISFVLGGCREKNTLNISGVDSLNVVEKENEILVDLTTVPLEGEFYEYIENNPIDAKYVLSDSGAEKRIKSAVEYRDAWMQEIDHSLINLKEYLLEDDYKKLCLASDGWKKYIENTLEVEQSLFYVGSHYAGVSNIAGDSLTYPQVMEVMALRTRNFAVELKSLEYAFTGTVEFVFE
ncbi:MAG: hypothetical protein IKY23_11165 [Lachnospiraceae bacterium]|nr:hypothetical protein [Lachnospiraceae bacterium]